MRALAVGHDPYRWIWRDVRAALEARGHEVAEAPAGPVEVTVAWGGAAVGAANGGPVVRVLLGEGVASRGERVLVASEWLREAVGAVDAVVLRPGADSRFEQRAVPPWRGRLLCLDASVADVAVGALAGLPDARLVLDGAAADVLGAVDLGAPGRVRVQRSPPEAVVEAVAGADAVVCGPAPWCETPLWAMAVGRPVVAVGPGQGAGELLRDRVNALLVEPSRGAAGVADAVRRLAEDAGLRSALRVGGLETVERHSAPAFAAAVAAELESAAGVR